MNVPLSNYGCRRFRERPRHPNRFGQRKIAAKNRRVAKWVVSPEVLPLKHVVLGFGRFHRGEFDRVSSATWQTGCDVDVEIVMRSQSFFFGLLARIFLVNAIYDVFRRKILLTYLQYNITTLIIIPELLVDHPRRVATHSCVIKNYAYREESRLVRKTQTHIEETSWQGSLVGSSVEKEIDSSAVIAPSFHFIHREKEEIRKASLVLAARVRCKESIMKIRGN